MTTLTEHQILSLVDQAVAFGVEQLGQQSALAIQYGSVWLKGYIYGNKTLTENDIQSLRATIKNFYFI